MVVPKDLSRASGPENTTQKQVSTVGPQNQREKERLKMARANGKNGGNGEKKGQTFQKVPRSGTSIHGVRRTKD